MPGAEAMGELKLATPYARGALPALDEEATLDRLCAELAPLFAPPFDAERSSLAVVSSNAGARSAVEFWSQAQRVGLAVASPALFPWTLANAACGRLAREFGVRGPNYTFSGRAAALSSALQQLADDLHFARVTAGWIVAIDFAGPSRARTLFAALRAEEAHHVELVSTAANRRAHSRLCAAAQLRRLIPRSN